MKTKVSTRTVNALADWCTISAHRDPGADCLFGADGSRLSNADVAHNVGLLAEAFRTGGLGRGDRMAIMATDSPWALMSLLAANRAGITVVPINFRATDRDLKHIVELTEPAAFISDVAYAQRIDSVVEPGNLRATIDAPFGETPSVAQLAGAVTDSMEEGGLVDDEAIACIALTSGTTGAPKAVLQSQRMLKSIVVNNLIETGIGPDDRLYSGAPLFHVAGLGNALCGIARGASSVLLPQFEPDAVLKWMKDGGLTFCVLMPTMLVSLLEHPDVRSSSYEQLRGILFGGAPLSTEVLQEIAEVFHCDLFNGFGAGTEAGGQAMLLPEEHRAALAGQPKLLGSIGRAMFGVDLKICDASGAEVADGVVGEIHTRSESVMSGYMGRPDLTAARITPDGWFHGGDLAWRDAAGYLHLAGRADDMLIRGGENIHPTEVEHALVTCPGVADAAVVGLPDPLWGEIVAAFVVLQVGTDELDLAHIREHCRGRIASYKLPEFLRIVDELPRNATGKLLRGRLRELVK